MGQSIQTSVIAHLETLRFNFEGYFGDSLSTFDSWARFPFSVSLEQINDNDLAKDELIDIRNNQKLLKDFESMELDEFWCKMVQAYPTLAKRISGYSSVCCNISLRVWFLCARNNKDQCEEQVKCHTRHAPGSLKYIA